MFVAYKLKRIICKLVIVNENVRIIPDIYQQGFVSYYY